MTSDPSIARSVARLENDRDSLYELVDDFRTETRARFDAHDARFDAHDARFDAHDARFDAHDGRFDKLEARFDKVEGTLAEVLRRLPEPR